MWSKALSTSFMLKNNSFHQCIHIPDFPNGKYWRMHRLESIKEKASGEKPSFINMKEVDKAFDHIGTWIK